MILMLDHKYSGSGPKMSRKHRSERNPQVPTGARQLEDHDGGTRLTHQSPGSTSDGQSTCVFVSLSPD